MSMLVVDASIAVKWFKPDEKSSRADFFLEEHVAGRENIFVPVLMLYEVANALWVSRRLSRSEIDGALRLLADARLTYIPPDESLLTSSLAISEKTKLSIYDASYLALAHRMGCPLATADKKIFREAKGTAEIILL